MRNLALALTLSAKDAASKVLRQAMQDSIKQTKAAEKASDELAKSQQQNATVGIRASRSLSDEYRRASSARSTLGIRSEREIQREIQQTQAAYMRLTRSGVMSANEQSRAFTAMTQRVGRLRDELKGATNEMSRMERARGWGANAMAVAGGIAAGAAVVGQPVKKQVSYEKQLLSMANTGFNDLSVDGRIQKVGVMDKAIRGAVKRGGGTREQAAETLNTIFAGGQVDSETAMAILPEIMRTATASGADPNDLAKMASAAIALFNIKKEELPLFFDKTLRSGENGNFELRDMAKELPAQMAKGKSLGMGGLNDVDKLLAYNQANALTAGDNNAAATNVNNLLDKIPSSDIKNSMKNYRFKGKDGNLQTYEQFLVSQRSKGVNTADAFMKAITGIVEGNKDYKSLKDKLSKAKGTDKEADLTAAMDVLVSSLIANIVADQQAGMALKTNILKKDFINEQIKGTNEAKGAGDIAFGVMSSSNDYKMEQLNNSRDFAQMDSIKPLSDVLGRLSGELSDYAAQYPGLTTAIAGAEVAIKAMTAAAVVFAGIKFFSGGGLGGVKAPSTPGGLTGPGSLGRAAGTIGRWAGRIAAPLMLYQATQDAPLVKVERGDGDARKRVQAGQYSDDLSRLKDSARAQPGLLDAWDEVKSWWSPPTSIGKGDMATAGAPSYLFPQQNQKSQPIQVTTKLELDGRTIAESVNEYNGNQAERGPTGMPQ